MEEELFYSVIDYEVDGHETQSALIGAFAALQEQWVRFYPGYRSATLLASVGGDRVYNVVCWASEADYYRFEETSDRAGRTAAIETVLAGVPGRVEPRMTGVPRFRVARVVRPGPRPDALPPAMEAAPPGGGDES